MFVRRYHCLALALALPASLGFGCKAAGDAPEAAAPQVGAKAEAHAKEALKSGKDMADKIKPAKKDKPAAVGEKAPDFELKDLDGNVVRLSALAGKTVVLEWFNPGCPFVKAAHTQGSLKDMAARHASEELVWLAINSGAPGKQGNGVEANRKGVETFGMKHPVLVDESGKVGRLYGAKRTPHMFVIGPDGTLVYRGAIDNSPDGTGESPETGTLVNYVEKALTALHAGAAVEQSETKAYGCSVKYGSI